jgi:hypothetical protein
VTVNCNEVPLGTIAAEGVTVIESKDVAASIIIVEAETPPAFAVMIAVPELASAVARPPAAICAIERLLDPQTTLEVMFWIVLSVKVPMAVNCWVLVTVGA